MANATLPIVARSRALVAVRLRGRLLWISLVLPFAAVGIWRGLGTASVAPETPPFEPRSLPARVSALGRLSPAGEVVAVAPPTPTGAMAGARVERLLVEAGDQIEAGQIVAVLDTRRVRAATVLEAKAKVEVARAKLAQVLAGPKPQEVQTQEALIRRCKADLVAAEQDFTRGSRLVGSNTITREDHTGRRLKFEQAQAMLEQAEAELESIKAIRPVDVKAAEAEVGQAEASLAVAEEDLRNTEVRSPLSGQILCIHARPGERVGDRGILEVGDTKAMHVVAEVYEEDVGRVQIGQTAKVRVPTLGTELSGVVVAKNLVVSRKIIFSNDPVADIDARVVEVRIRLSAADGARVAGLSNARVEVVIAVTAEGE